jgi:hypothetical protein
MITRLFILIIMVTAGAGTLQAQAKSKAAPPAKAAGPPKVEPPPAMAVPKDYQYDRRGRRDPFINPVPKPVNAGPAIPAIRPPGLPGVLVSEAVLAGVVVSKEPSMNVAIIKAPGNRTFFAHPGDALFDARIKEIRADGVVFTLSTPGRPSTTPAREIERKVRPTGE